MRPRARLIAAIALFVALFAIGRFTGFLEHLDAEGIRTRVEEAGPLGVLLFIAGFCIGELLHVPGIIFVAAACLAFGKSTGFVLGFGGALVSVAFTFAAVRLVGGRALTTVERPFMKKMLAKLDQRPITTVIVLRTVLWLAPALNYALALSNIRFRDYLIGSALGLLAPVALITLATDLFL